MRCHSRARQRNPNDGYATRSRLVTVISIHGAPKRTVARLTGECEHLHPMLAGHPSRPR
jgi:hypothetical protein